MPNYLIAATPRTGSFLLCEGLEAAGIAGRPQEYASLEDVATWRDHHGFTNHLEYFFRFPEICGTPNGVFGAKFMWFQFFEFGRDAGRYLRIGPDPVKAVGAYLGPVHIVRLVRHDTLRQAVSWVRAQASGRWSRRRSDPVVPDTPVPRYDPAMLSKAIHSIDQQNRRWDAAVDAFGTPVLTIAYEELVADYPATIKRVLSFLELSAHDVSIGEPLLQRQADDLTESWVQRARLDLTLA